MVVGAENFAFVLANNSIANAQPQPGALADFFGGKEWIEDPLGVLDALSVVAEKDFEPVAVLQSLNLNHTRTSGRAHRVVSVVQNVEKHLLQLVGIGDQLRQAIVKSLHHFHAMVGEIVGTESDRLAQNIVDLQRLPLRRPLPRKAQQVLYDFLGALRFFQNHLQVLAGAARHFRILHQQVGKSHDGRQRVVDFVGHAGDQLSHRRHFFRLHQLRLDHSGIRDVSHQHYHARDFAALVAHWAQVHGKFSLRFVAPHDHQLQIVRLQAVQTGVKSFRKDLFRRRRNDPVEAVSNQLVLLEGAGFIGAAGGGADPNRRIGHHDHGLSVIENLAGEVSLALQLRLNVLDVGDVQKYAAILQDFSLAVADHESVFQCVDHGAVAAAEGHLKIAHRAIVVQAVENFVALLGGDVHLGTQVELQDFLTRLVAEHAHQSVIHFDEMPFRRGKEDAFLHVVKQLAVTPLGFPAVRDVLEHVHGLQSFIERAMNARARNQVAALQHGMEEFVGIALFAAERTR